MVLMAIVHRIVGLTGYCVNKQLEDGLIDSDYVISGMG
jgi:hypothetical protein